MVNFASPLLNVERFDLKNNLLNCRLIPNQFFEHIVDLFCRIGSDGEAVEVAWRE